MRSGVVELVDLNEKVSLNRVLNVVLTIILLGTLVFGWWYLTRKNPVDWLTSNISPVTDRPRYLYSIYGGGGINFKRPSQTVVHDNKIYVADTNNGRMAVFNYRGRYMSGFGASEPGKLKYPMSITFSDKNIFVADVGTKKIHVYNMDGQFTGFFAEGLVNEPCSVFYKDKSVFIVDKHSMKIVVVDESGKQKTSFGGKGTVPGKFYYPYSVYVSNENKVYVADSNNNRIQILSEAGVPLYSLTGQDIMGIGRYSVPRGTAFDKKGNLYVAEGLANCISVTNEEGQVVTRFKEAEPNPDSGVADSLSLPTSVFVDDRQRLYVTEFGKSRILVYELNN